MSGVSSASSSFFYKSDRDLSITFSARSLSSFSPSPSQVVFTKGGDLRSIVFVKTIVDFVQLAAMRGGLDPALVMDTAMPTTANGEGVVNAQAALLPIKSLQRELVKEDLNPLHSIRNTVKKAASVGKARDLLARSSAGWMIVLALLGLNSGDRNLGNVAMSMVDIGRISCTSFSNFGKALYSPVFFIPGEISRGLGGVDSKNFSLFLDYTKRLFSLIMTDETVRQTLETLLFLVHSANKSQAFCFSLHHLFGTSDPDIFISMVRTAARSKKDRCLPDRRDSLSARSHSFIVKSSHRTIKASVSPSTIDGVGMTLMKLRSANFWEDPFSEEGGENYDPNCGKGEEEEEEKDCTSQTTKNNNNFQAQNLYAQSLLWSFLPISLSSRSMRRPKTVFKEHFN